MRYSNVRSRFWISFPLYEMCACIDNFVISNSLFFFVVTRLVKANYRMSWFVAGSVGYVPRASLNKWNRSKCIECWIMWLASIFNNSLKMNFFFTKSYKLCKSMNLIIEHNVLRIIKCYLWYGINILHLLTLHLSKSYIFIYLYRYRWILLIWTLFIYSSAC